MGRNIALARPSIPTAWALAIALMVSLIAGVSRAEDARPAPAADQAAIRTVIQSQLAAFQRDDGNAAFSYASPGIQGIFQSPERFMTMVRTGYAAVYRPSEVVFLEARVKDGITAQAVRFVGPDGDSVIAIYFMERQPDGSWRIDGVRILPIAETTS